MHVYSDLSAPGLSSLAEPSAPPRHAASLCLICHLRLVAIGPVPACLGCRKSAHSCIRTTLGVLQVWLSLLLRPTSQKYQPLPVNTGHDAFFAGCPFPPSSSLHLLLPRCPSVANWTHSYLTCQPHTQGVHCTVHSKVISEINNACRI